MIFEHIVLGTGISRVAILLNYIYLTKVTPLGKLVLFIVKEKFSELEILNFNIREVTSESGFRCLLILSVLSINIIIMCTLRVFLYTMILRSFL